MAIGESTSTTGVTATPVAIHNIDEIDGATVTERAVQYIVLGYLTATGKFQPVDLSTGLPIDFVNAVEFTGDVTITADVEVPQVTPTITAGAYTAGDVVGGQQTFTNALRDVGRGAVLHNVTVVDKGNVKAALDLVFFHSSATIPANNAIFTWNSADYTKVLGWCAVSSGDWNATTNPRGYRTIGGDAIATVPANFEVFGNGTQNLFMAIILPTGSAPTYTSTTDLIISLGLLRD